jgi:hypothetical protein
MSMRRGSFYPVADNVPGVPAENQRTLRAMWTGEPQRMIKAGEWYLSGAIITAYRARSEVGPYYPAKLAVTETATITRFVKYLEVPR